MDSAAAFAFMALSTVVSGTSLQVQGATVGDQGLDHRKLGISYKHLGCFADKKDDRVMTMTLRDTSMTTELCCDKCAEASSAYCALQFGQECWCTQDEQLDYSRHGVGNCDIWCGGDGSSTCGGVDSIDIYALAIPSPPVGEGYLGCFADSPSDRVMGEKIAKSDMTAEVCLEHCMSQTQPFEYYATQFGSECWCGLSDSLDDYDRHGPGVCRTPCSGDCSNSCGGFDAFDLFYNRKDGEPSSSSDDTGVITSEGDDEEDPMVKLFVLHNAARCVHATDPLVYDNNVVVTAAAYATELATDEYCGSAEVPDESGLGSNIHICGTSDQENHCFNVHDVMSDFYFEEVGGGAPSAWGPEATQLLWKETTLMGCALSSCQKEGMMYDILVCHYSLPASYENAMDDEVNYQVKSFQECGFDRQ